MDVRHRVGRQKRKGDNMRNVVTSNEYPVSRYSSILVEKTNGVSKFFVRNAVSGLLLTNGREGDYKNFGSYQAAKNQALSMKNHYAPMEPKGDLVRAARYGRI